MKLIPEENGLDITVRCPCHNILIAVRDVKLVIEKSFACKCQCCDLTVTAQNMIITSIGKDYKGITLDAEG